MCALAWEGCECGRGGGTDGRREGVNSDGKGRPQVRLSQVKGRK